MAYSKARKRMNNKNKVSHVFVGSREDNIQWLEFLWLILSWERECMTINNNRVSFAFADNKEDDDQQ